VVDLRVVWPHGNNPKANGERNQGDRMTHTHLESRVIASG
jgi:hypothetical protein